MDTIPTLKTTNPATQISNTIQAKASLLVDNYYLIVALSIAIILMICLYIFSKVFRVSRVVDTMKIYQKYQEISAYPYSKAPSMRIGDMRIASAHNAAHIGYQIFDYTSEDIVLACLQSGARYLEFQVFNSEYGERAIPVVSMGYKTGEWKLTLTDTPLEYIFNIIAKNAFTIQAMGADGMALGGGVPNPDDPIFIGLKLNTNYNIACLDKIAQLIIDYFQERLIDNKYSYQASNDIADMKMSTLLGKIIIFASEGFQGSRLEELVNYSWDNVNNRKIHKMRRIVADELDSTNFNRVELKEFNKTGLSIVVPSGEGAFWSDNIDPNIALSLGCQFVAMNYQLIDANMDKYITMFKNASIIRKPTTLRALSTSSKQPQD